jgi:cyclase
VRRRTFVLIVLVAAVAAIATATTIVHMRAGTRQDTLNKNANASFRIERVGPDVYAAIRKEPPGLMFNANVVFIVCEKDVIVVDTNLTPSSARETLEALRQITPKPVTAVINTHWHDDHIMGNQVYRTEFPTAEFIAQTTTLDELPKTGAANRQQLLDRGPLVVQTLQTSVEQEKSLTGEPLGDEERASHVSDIALAQHYFAEAPSTSIVMPTTTVQDRLTLTRGSRTIDILYLGRGHTAADLVVHLPAEGIVIAGDLVVWPVPLIGSTSHPAEFGATIDKLVALKPSTIVPGHGPVMKDDSYAKLVSRLVKSLSTQVDAAVARSETLDQARKSVRLDDFRKELVHDSTMLGIIFDNYVTSSGVAAAYKEATAAKGGR